MGSLSNRDKRLLIITLVILVIGVIYIGSKLMSNGAQDTVVSAETEKRFEDLFDKMANVEEQKSQNLLLRKKIGNERGKFVSEKEISKFLAEIESVGGRSGVTISGYSPSVNRRSRPLASLEVKVNFQCQFNNLVQFLNNVREANLLMQPSTLKVSLKDKNKPDLEGQVTLITYLLNAQPAPVTPGNTIAGAQ